MTTVLKVNPEGLLTREEEEGRDSSSIWRGALFGGHLQFVSSLLSFWGLGFCGFPGRSGIAHHSPSPPTNVGSSEQQISVITVGL